MRTRKQIDFYLQVQVRASQLWVVFRVAVDVSMPVVVESTRRERAGRAKPWYVLLSALPSRRKWPFLCASRRRDVPNLELCEYSLCRVATSRFSDPSTPFRTCGTTLIHGGLNEVGILRQSWRVLEKYRFWLTLSLEKA